MNVIIVEPHPYHYEVIAGIVKYFIDMEYNIDILVRKNFEERDVLCKLENPSKIKITKYNNEDELKQKLLDESIEQFDFVFFSSLEYFHDGKKERILDFLGQIPKTKFGFLGIYHNLDMISDNELEYLREGRIFTLSEFNYKGIDTKVLSAHLFGNIKENRHINDVKQIVLIGLSNRRMLIENAVEQLMKNNEYESLNIVVVGQLKWQKDLVKRCISNCIYYICKASKLRTPYELCTIRSWKAVKLVGKMSFKNMFELIENSDFIGIILDPNDYQSKPFLRLKTSGSKQLAFGFNKPVLINNRFAEAYGFNDNNGVCYFDSDIDVALNKIKNMSDETYQKLVKNIKKDSDRLYTKSLKNLKSVISEIKDNVQSK